MTYSLFSFRNTSFYLENISKASTSANAYFYLKNASRYTLT